ncbi:hypothetical protein [Bacillus cereus]|uniref:hypothetical protein n=1 Tax=Bacillus cereus TaxID=1396 RepID=UPI0030131BEF
MESKKLQMLINPTKAPEAYQLVKRWETEGAGEKGYENKKILEILHAWSHLMELYGVTDTMKLAMLLARGTAVPVQAIPVQHAIEPEPKELRERSEETIQEADQNDQDYLALLAGVQAHAKMKRNN